MTLMPGARHVPLGPQTQPRSRGHHFACIHTMVGSLLGTRGMFQEAGYTGTESHFGTGGLGEIEQWQDIQYTADANYQGSGDVVSIENADHGPGFLPWNTRANDDVPAFTAPQAEANARILAWVSTPEAHLDCPPSALCHQVGIPLALIPDTRPGRRGVGYHAQGVPNNGLVSGGTAWSKYPGKVCPGGRRIAQIPGIIARAIEIRSGDDIVTPEDRTAIATLAARMVWDYSIDRRGNIGPAPAHVWLTHGAIQADTGATVSQHTDATVGPMPATLAGIVATGDDVQAKLGEQAATISAAILEAIDAAGASIDQAIVRDAVDAAVSRLTIVLPESGNGSA